MKSLTHIARISCIIGIIGLLSSCTMSKSHDGAESPSKHDAVTAFKPEVPERWTLPNGLKVMFLHDAELPLVSGNLYLHGGALWESKPGAVEAMGTMLRLGGTKALAPDALDKKLEQLSGAISSTFNSEFGTVSFSCLNSDFEQIFSMTSDVALQPRFDASRLALWKSQSIESIERRSDDPWNVASIAFSQLLFGDTPYGHVSVKKDVEQLTVAELQSLHSKFVVPDGAILAVTGNIDRHTLEEAVAKQFGGWKPRGHSIGDFPPVTFTPTPGIYFVPLPLAQASIYIGEQGVKRLSDDYAAIDGFNQVFGSGFFGSRLMKSIRAELGLAYSISGGVYAGPIKGRDMIAFQTKSVSVGEAIRNSIKQLELLQREAPSAQELAEVQRAVKNSFIFKFDSPDKVLNRRATQELLGYPANYDETYLGKIAALTPEDIKSVAQRRWNIADFVIVVVGNESAYSSLQTLMQNPPDAFKGRTIRRMEFKEKLVQ